MKTKNYKRYLSTLLVVLTLSVVGYTSAYVMAGFAGVSGQSDVYVGIEESTFMHFTQTGHIDLNVTQDNFSDKDGNISNEVTASVVLKGTALTPKTYHVSLFIGENTYVYSTQEEKPELLLNIYDKDENEIKVIDGLEYVTINGVSGFDVTIIKTEKYILFEELEIEIPLGETTISHDYVIKLTMINLETNQGINTGRTFEAQFVFTELENEINYIESVVLDNYNTTYDELVLQEDPNFNVNAGTTKSIHTMEDDYTSATGRESIYFRGAVDNNWVYFGGFYWRIIRIDGAGNVKIIYSGKTAPTAAQSIVKTGADTHIGQSYYNYSITGAYAELVGYMYSSGESHGLSNNSIAKTKIDEWYEITLLGTEDEKYIEDSVYCNDRSVYTEVNSDLIGTASTTTGYDITLSGIQKNFGPRLRIVENYDVVLTCLYKDDLFSVDNTLNGNGALKYAVALLTTDEATASGFLSNNKGDYYKSGYLYTGTSYYTMSPMTSIYASASVGTVSMNGGTRVMYVAAVNNDTFTNPVYEELNALNGVLRPVITIKASMPTTGDGTYNNPFTLTTN